MTNAFLLGDGELLDNLGGDRSKYFNNVEAIRLAKQIGNGVATAEDQRILSRYTGWGSTPVLKYAFPPRTTYEDTSWSPMSDEIKALNLTDDEIRALRASSLNAHFTSIPIIKAIWRVVQHLGISNLKTPRILEPSAGIGHFFSAMPVDLANDSKRVAIELDKLTSDILRLLHPGITVHNCGFESAMLPMNYFDLIISNIPFGDYPVLDKGFKENYIKGAIHDYFFAKAVQMVRPGGLVVFITSRYTMDKTDPRLREWLAERADLLGMVRLPDNTFMKNAGTKVVTDIVILRKKDETPFIGLTNWTNTVTQHMSARNGYGTVSMSVNQEYSIHPDWVFGTPELQHGMYGDNAYTIEPDGRNVEEEIVRILTSVLPKDILGTSNSAPEVIDEVPAVKKSLFFISETATADQKVRMAALKRVYDAAKDLLDAEINDRQEDAVELRLTLNREYDGFAAIYGCINSPANLKFLRDNPALPFLKALESKYDPTLKESTKAAIFQRSTVRGNLKAQGWEQLSPVERAQEALINSLDKKGKVDIAFIAHITGDSREGASSKLIGRIFRTPEGEWETAEEYLSGNVLKKLADARAIATVEPEIYAVNVDALERVQPEPLGSGDIMARMGASWIPASVIKDFLQSIITGFMGTVTYLAAVSQWAIEEDKRYTYRLNFNDLTITWGTSRRNAIELAEDALNMKQPVIRDSTGDDSPPVINQTATVAAQAKLAEMKERFATWVWEDVDRTKLLCGIYNEKFNNLRSRRFDGSHLTLRGFNPDIKLLPHQLDAIWRAIQSKTTLLGHVVGAGKAQPLDAKTLTPTGWKTMGDMVIGEAVIAGDGSVTHVTGVFPQGEKEIFKVTFSDGSSTECCDDHLWLTQTYAERNLACRKPAGKVWPSSEPKVRTLREIRATLVASHLGAKNHSISVVGPVQFQSQTVPIDPYLLGVILGDGHIAMTSLMLSTPDSEIVEECRQALPADLVLRQQADERCPTYGIRMAENTRGFQKRHPMLAALEGLGLPKTLSYNKFVPEIYKFNSVEVRLAVLQGLMDTDGWVDKRGHSCYFSTSSHYLVEDVTFLVQSLGGTVQVTEKTPHYPYKGERRTGRLAFSVCVKLPANICPFRLPRKRDLILPKTKYVPIRYIVDVQPVGRKAAQCISVAHLDELYVTDDFIVTHNTLCMICSAMEMKRLGLAKKAMVVVPNHLTEQWMGDILQAYPDANVLCAGKDDMSKSRRGEFMSKIATNDWDIVIIPASSFKLLPVSLDTQIAFTQDELDRLHDALDALVDSGASRSTQKQIEKAIKRLTVVLATMLDMKKDDTATITYEELGVDLLMADEFHLFKNLFFVSKMTRVPGLPNTRSERALDMFMKIRWTIEHGGRAIGATGTPVANTLAEVYTMMRYFQLELLKENGIESFDAWAQTFAEVVPSLEMTPDGSGFRMNSRFAKFVNLPELATMWRQVLDVRTAEQLNLPRPKLHTGKPVIVATPGNGELAAYIKSLVERVDAIRRKEVQPWEDNMLKITGDGRKAALDMRLVVATSQDNPGGKINTLVGNVHNVWEGSEKRKGVQLIFCDLGTPKKVRPVVAEEEGVVDPDADPEDEYEDPLDAVLMNDVYNEIKRKLVRLGIPEHEIKFIHDCKTPQQRSELFTAVRAGEVRVLIGSTEKMGTGMNVQTLLVALHNLDAPWRPADIEQREGRMMRRGNEYPEVAIFNYVTEGSFDGYVWQVLETKARFISQIMAGEITAHTAEDVGDMVLTMSAVKALASGNPKVMQKVALETELTKMSHIMASWRSSKSNMQFGLVEMPANIDFAEKETKLHRAILDTYKSFDGKDFSMELADKPNGETRTVYTKREDAGKQVRLLAEMCYQAVKHDVTMAVSSARFFHVGAYKGHELLLKAWANPLINPELWPACGEEMIEYYAAKISDSNMGIIQSLEAQLRGSEARYKMSKDRLDMLIIKRDQLKTEIDKPWEHAEKYDRMRRQLAILDLELQSDNVHLDTGMLSVESMDVENIAPSFSIVEIMDWLRELHDPTVKVTCDVVPQGCQAIPELLPITEPVLARPSATPDEKAIAEAEARINEQQAQLIYTELERKGVKKRTKGYKVPESQIGFAW